MKRTINGIVLEAEYGWGHPASGVEQFNRNFARLHFGLSLPEVVDWFYKLTAEQLHAEGKNRAEEHGIVQAEGWAEIGKYVRKHFANRKRRRLMAIGQTFTGHVTAWTDPEFGYKIIQPLEQDGNRIMYFTSNCFCRDNESMLISAVRDGIENFYVIRFLEGTYTQVTDESGIDISHAYFDKPRDLLYYANGHQIKSVNIKTFEQKLVYESDYQFSSITVTCDGAYLLSSYPFKYSYTGNDQDPRTVELFRMFKIHLQTGKWSRILDRSFDIDYIQCSPTDPDHLIFCSRGFYSTHHRIWHSNLDGTKGGALGPEQPNEHRTHEYYTPDGRRIAYHGKFFKIDENERFKNIGHTWGSMNIDGTDDKFYRCLRGLQAGHSSMSFNQQMVVTDGNDYLSLLRLNESKSEADFEPIFRHQSSMKANFVHAHPCFSNDDQYIAFCTDFMRKDRGNVYLLDLQSK